MRMRTLLPMKISRQLVEIGENQIMAHFQDSRLLSFVARAAFLVVLIVYFSWHRAGNGAVMKTWEASFLPELFRDLNGIGLLGPDASSQIPHVVQNRVDPVDVEGSTDEIHSGTLDFVIAAGDDSGFRFADSALKIGGIAAVQIALAADKPFHIPSNFQIVYIRRFPSTEIAIRKIAEDPSNILLAGPRTAQLNGRRILAVPEVKMEALIGFEDVALEPPAKGRLKPHHLTRYLPDLLGDSLSNYRRRVFVDVGPADRPGSELWFARQYPTKNLDFEIIRLDINDASRGGDSAASAAGGAGSVTEWLQRNVRDEDFVVMKAEAETVEEIVKGRAIALVDELFLECRNQWQKEKGAAKSRRAYWECLALYGKLWDEGVVVHQWWE